MWLWGFIISLLLYSLILPLLIVLRSLSELDCIWSASCKWSMCCIVAPVRISDNCSPRAAVLLNGPADMRSVVMITSRGFPPSACLHDGSPQGQIDNRPTAAHPRWPFSSQISPFDLDEQFQPAAWGHSTSRLDPLSCSCLSPPTRSEQTAVCSKLVFHLLHLKYSESGKCSDPLTLFTWLCCSLKQLKSTVTISQSTLNTPQWRSKKFRTFVEKTENWSNQTFHTIVFEVFLHLDWSPPLDSPLLARGCNNKVEESEFTVWKEAGDCLNEQLSVGLNRSKHTAENVHITIHALRLFWFMRVQYSSLNHLSSLVILF